VTSSRSEFSNHRATTPESDHAVVCHPGYKEVYLLPVNSFPSQSHHAVQIDFRLYRPWFHCIYRNRRSRNERRRGRGYSTFNDCVSIVLYLLFIYEAPGHRYPFHLQGMISRHIVIFLHSPFRSVLNPKRKRYVFPSSYRDMFVLTAV
jgi:hypothetical protein